MESVKLTPEQWQLYQKLLKEERVEHSPLLDSLFEAGVFIFYVPVPGSSTTTTTKLKSAECKLECLQWRRESNGKLCLYVFENNKWVRYTEAQHYVPDIALSTNSGFATAQKYLQLGYTYKQTKEVVTDE